MREFGEFEKRERAVEVLRDEVPRKQPEQRVGPSLKGRLWAERGAIGRHRTLLVMSVITELGRISKSGSSRRGSAGHEPEEGKKSKGVGDNL